MAHRATFYIVRVKEKWRDYRPLGDIDDGGTYVGDVLREELGSPDFEQMSFDGSKVVRGMSADYDASGDLCVALQHGQSGVAALIVAEDGTERLRQTWTDSQLLRCCSVFRLPKARDVGWLATHVNNGRGTKGLMEAGLRERFAQRFSDLKLEINPFVRRTALEEAVQQGRVEKVRLRKVEQPHDRAIGATNKWVRTSDFGKLELEIEARGESHLIPRLLQRFLRGDQTAYAEIVEFEGLEFDEASVQVTLADGTERTFHLEKPDAGHPMSMDLDDLALDAEGDPTEDSVYAALKNGLRAVL
jgi:hypothetical protein